MAFGCIFLMCVALYMQHGMGLEPCPMCIVQRLLVVGTGAVALAAALHNPGMPGIRVYGLLTALFALAGVWMSGRHVWLQNLPEDAVPACGPDLDYMLEVFPLTEVLYLLFFGDGNCAEVVWSFLGLSIPGWTLLAFLGLTAICIWQILRPQQS